MLTNKKKFVLAIAASSILLIGQIVYANTKKPGSSEDPLVTLSFVEQKIDQLKYYIDEQVLNNNDKPSVDTGAGFEVVELKVGSSLIAGKGVELILRGGKTIAIDSLSGGLSDVTGAKDLTKNENIPANHLIIIPRDDGRGIKATTDIFVMAKGSYEIKY